jgi:hypothetical protein
MAIPVLPPVGGFGAPGEGPVSVIPPENRGAKAWAAIGGTPPPPASDIPEENRGAKARAATGDCIRQICWPKILPFVDPKCYCTSDVVVYTAAVIMMLIGVISMFTGGAR